MIDTSDKAAAFIKNALKTAKTNEEKAKALINLFIDFNIIKNDYGDIIQKRIECKQITSIENKYYFEDLYSDKYKFFIPIVFKIPGKSSGSSILYKDSYFAMHLTIYRGKKELKVITHKTNSNSSLLPIDLIPQENIDKGSNSIKEIPYSYIFNSKTSVFAGENEMLSLICKSDNDDKTGPYMLIGNTIPESTNSNFLGGFPTEKTKIEYEIDGGKKVILSIDNKNKCLYCDSVYTKYNSLEDFNNDRWKLGKDTVTFYPQIIITTDAIYHADATNVAVTARKNTDALTLNLDPSIFNTTSGTDFIGGNALNFDLRNNNTESFEKKIKSGIAEASIFLFVLSNGSLGRCCNDGDWVRKEIEYAFELQKNIVPVNPDREFGDFPNDCPELVRKALGQHTFVEIFTGQQLKPTIETLVKQRIQPIVSPTKNGGDEVPVYIEVDMDSQIEVFDKPLCAVEAGVCKDIYMRAGMKKITAISAENPVDRIVIKPKILANEDNYIEIKLSSIKEEREKEELERKHKAEEQKRKEAEEQKRKEAEEQKRKEAEEQKRKEAEEQKRKEAERIRIEEERKKEEARKFNNHNGHEYVDLGLPSGLKWATCNVGATKPEEYGDYYAWGEIKPKQRYVGDNYTYKSNPETLPLSADAANVSWGGSWRMPTKVEQDELRNHCTWEWTTLNGEKGYKVISKKNGNSIFLPAAAYRNSSNLSGAGRFGHYWSSSLNATFNFIAYFLYFYSSNVCLYEYNDRYCGRSVRAVCE
jgi:hypothetical protein